MSPDRWSTTGGPCSKRLLLGNGGSSSPTQVLRVVKSIAHETQITSTLRYRHLFEMAMRQEGLSLEEEVVGNYVFIKVHTPFERLSQEAEFIKLDLPLDGVSLGKSLSRRDHRFFSDGIWRFGDCCTL